MAGLYSKPGSSGKKASVSLSNPALGKVVSKPTTVTKPTVPFGSKSTPPPNMLGGTPKPMAQGGAYDPGSAPYAARTAAPINTQDNYPTQTDYDTLSAYQTPAVNPDTDYLQEAGYVAQVGALEEALKAFKSQDTADRGRYDLDYDKGLRDLGYKDNTPDVTTDNLDDLQLANGAGRTARGWDWNDVLTASGRGYQNNTNDFASRGMLQSQGYFDSLKNLERSLEDQRDSMGTGRQNFRGEKDTAMTNYTNQDVAARNAAKVDAIARLSAGLGLS